MIKSTVQDIASLWVKESILFEDDERLKQWENFAEIAYNLPVLKEVHDKGLVKGIEALRTGYELVDGYVDKTMDKPETKTYVFVNSQKNSLLSRFWHWLLMSLPEVGVLTVDINKNIEFITQSERTIRNLEMLCEWDCGELFYGTLEEYYIELS